MTVVRMSRGPRELNPLAKYVDMYINDRLDPLVEYNL